MVIGGKVCRDFFDRHCPTVHTKVPAPPKTKSTVRFFSGLYFIKHCAGSVCFLKSFFANIAHSGKIYHKAAFVFADVWVIRRVYKKALLLLKNICGKARPACAKPKKKNEADIKLSGNI